MYWNRNLCFFAACSTRCISRKRLSVCARSVLKLINEPGIPSDSLEITISVTGLQNPAEPSMMYCSAGGRSVNGCGVNWAAAGAAATATEASAPAMRPYSRVADLFSIPVDFSGSLDEQTAGGRLVSG